MTPGAALPRTFVHAHSGAAASRRTSANVMFSQGASGRQVNHTGRHTEPRRPVKWTLEKRGASSGGRGGPCVAFRQAR